MWAQPGALPPDSRGGSRRGSSAPPRAGSVDARPTPPRRRQGRVGPGSGPSAPPWLAAPGSPASRRAASVTLAATADGPAGAPGVSGPGPPLASGAVLGASARVGTRRAPGSARRRRSGPRAGPRPLHGGSDSYYHLTVHSRAAGVGAQRPPPSWHTGSGVGGPPPSGRGAGATRTRMRRGAGWGGPCHPFDSCPLPVPERAPCASTASGLYFPPKAGESGPSRAEWEGHPKRNPYCRRF